MKIPNSVSGMRKFCFSTNFPILRNVNGHNLWSSPRLTIHRLLIGKIDPDLRLKTYETQTGYPVKTWSHFNSCFAMVDSM